MRKRHRIRVKGGDAPTPLRSFEQLQARPGCPPGLAATLAGLGCRQPTPIQQQAIPVLLARREILAVAPTGARSPVSLILKASAKAHPAAGHPRAAWRGERFWPSRPLVLQWHPGECWCMGQRGGCRCVQALCMTSPC